MPYHLPAKYKTADDKQALSYLPTLPKPKN